MTGAGAGAVGGDCGGEGIPVAGVFLEVVFLFVGQVGFMRLWVRSFGVNMRVFVCVGGANWPRVCLCGWRKLAARLFVWVARVSDGASHVSP